MDLSEQFNFVCDRGPLQRVVFQDIVAEKKPGTIKYVGAEMDGSLGTTLAVFEIEANGVKRRQSMTEDEVAGMWTASRAELDRAKRERQGMGKPEDSPYTRQVHNEHQSMTDALRVLDPQRLAELNKKPIDPTRSVVALNCK